MNLPELFTLLVDRRATHLHIVPGSPVMARIGSSFAPVDDQLVSPADTAALLESFLSEEQRFYFFENKDLSITQSIPGFSRFRVNALQQRGSVAFVISAAPAAPPTMEELGIPDSLKNVISNTRQGLVLVCSSKGNGKTSTLASIVNYLLEMRPVQIVTLENPIEFLHKSKKGIICQREIGTDVLSFESGVEALAYEKADVVVLSDLETNEQINYAVNLAVGGTLVLAEMRVPNVLMAIEALMHAYPAHLEQHGRNLVAAAVECIVAQVLLRKASGPGVLPAFEVMAGIPPVRQMVREGKTGMLSGIMSQSGRDYGMQTQEQALRSLVKKSLVTQEEAYAKASRPEDFKKMMAIQF